MEEVVFPKVDGHHSDHTASIPGHFKCKINPKDNLIYREGFILWLNAGTDYVPGPLLPASAARAADCRGRSFKDFREFTYFGSKFRSFNQSFVSSFIPFAASHVALKYFLCVILRQPSVQHKAIRYCPDMFQTIWLILKNYTLWSSGQSFWLQIHRSRVRFPALPDFLSSSGSGTGPLSLVRSIEELLE